MNFLDYSKADVSRAKTAEYLPAQSLTGFYQSRNVNYPKGTDKSAYDGRVYPGDASRYYVGGQGYQPTQSYEQYAKQLTASQSYDPNLAQSQYAYYYQGQMGQGAPYYPQAYYAQQNVHYMPQPQKSHQRQYLPFRPMMFSQVNQVAQSRLPLDKRYSEQSQVHDYKVFCPACHQQYYNSQIEEHIERHYLYNTEQFKLSNLMMNDTRIEGQQQQATVISNQARFYYPLIEPQEFQCKELDEVDYLNKYKLQHQELNKKESSVKVRSQATQFAKPPLQLRSQNTDIYNCFDNIFSPYNSFDVNDVTKSNSFIAKKRQLNDWEKLKSYKEGYTIRTN